MVDTAGEVPIEGIDSVGWHSLYNKKKTLFVIRERKRSLKHSLTRV